MLKWLRLVMVGYLILSISAVVSGCKKKVHTHPEEKPAVEEKAPVEEGEEF